MKKYLMIIMASLTLVGCSKKTHVLDSTRVISYTKSTNDSSGQRKIVTQDKSITTTTMDIDTSITFTGRPLTGSIVLGATDSHFENDDLSMDLHTDTNTGATTATATPKKKTIPIHYHKKTIAQNNINKTETSKSDIKNTLQTKLDSTAKHVEDHKDPAVAVKSFKTVVIWFLVIIAVASILLYLISRFNIISLLKNFFTKIL